MINTAPDILSMLSRHELVIKQFYEIFAVKFPQYENFWKALVSDEQKHSNWLEALRADASLAPLIQNTIPLKPQAIQSSIGYVEQQIKRARESGFNSIQALAIARDLENALIERVFSRLGRSESPTIRTVVSDLTDETEKHRNMLAKALETEKLISTRKIL